MIFRKLSSVHITSDAEEHQGSLSPTIPRLRAAYHQRSGPGKWRCLLVEPGLLAAKIADRKGSAWRRRWGIFITRQVNGELRNVPQRWNPILNPFAEPYCYTTLVHLKDVFEKRWDLFSKLLPAGLASDRKRFLSSRTRLNLIRNGKHGQRGTPLPPRALFGRRSKAALTRVIVGYRVRMSHSQRNTFADRAVQMTKTATSAATSLQWADQASPFQIPWSKDTA